MTTAEQLIEPESAGGRKRPSDGDMITETAILNAVGETNWSDVKGWKVLDDLADDIEPESMVLYPEARSAIGDVIMLPVDLTVMLRYHATDAMEAADYPDTYPATVSLQTQRDGRLKVAAIKINVDRRGG